MNINIKTQSLLILAFVCGVMQAPDSRDSSGLQFPGPLGEILNLIPQDKQSAFLDVLHIPHRDGAVDAHRVISVNHALKAIQKTQDKTTTISELFSLGEPSAELPLVFTALEFRDMSTGGPSLILNLNLYCSGHKSLANIKLNCETRGIESSKELDLGHLPAILASPKVGTGMVTLASRCGSELVSPKFNPLSMDQLESTLKGYLKYLEIENGHITKDEGYKASSARLAAEYGAANVRVSVSGIDFASTTLIQPASQTVADFLRQMHLWVGEPAHVTQDLVFNDEILPPHLHLYDLLEPGQAEPHNLTCRVENNYIYNILRSSDETQITRDGVEMNYPELLKDKRKGCLFRVNRKQGGSDFASFNIFTESLDLAQPPESALRDILVITTQALDKILEISITGEAYTARYPRALLDHRFHVKHTQSTVELILKRPVSPERVLQLDMPQYGVHEPQIREYVEYYLFREIAEKISKKS